MREIRSELIFVYDKPTPMFVLKQMTDTSASVLVHTQSSADVKEQNQNTYCGRTHTSLLVLRLHLLQQDHQLPLHLLS